MAMKIGLMFRASTTMSSSCFSLKSPFLSTSSTSVLAISNISVLNSRRLSLSFIKDTSCKVSCSQVKIEGTIDDDEACELVSGVELSLGDGVDNVNASLFKAVKNNNGTGILLLSDIYGFEDLATRDFAYRVACNGYNVLVPDLFRGDPWEKNQPQTLFEPWLASQSPERVAKDIDTSVKWMVDEFLAAGISKKLGILGFCFGGGRVLEVLARDQGAYFGIGVSFYGTRIEPSVAATVKVPVLFIAGDNDPLCPVSGLQEIEKNIEGSNVVIYKGRGDGFAHRPQTPEEDGDAEKAFLVLRNWLQNGLVLSN